MSVPRPLVFKRGQTFSYSMPIPAAVPDGYLANWTLKAQLRRERNDTAAGLIATIVCYWLDSPVCRTLAFYAPSTQAWPLGLAEFDVTFTSPDGVVVPTTTALIQITRGITR